MLWGRGQKCKALAARLVAAVNAHDADAAAALMTADFAHIDSWRDGVAGRDVALAGMRAFFAADPGLQLEVENASFSDPYVLLRGWVNSAYPQVGRRRAVWRLRCERSGIAEWQSWAEGPVPSLSRTYSPDDTVSMEHRASDRPALP